MISGIFTIVLMLSFFAVIAWAWSDRRKEEFDHMANLPLNDDLEITNNNEGDENGDD